jgi:hypothetical protein
MIDLPITESGVCPQCDCTVGRERFAITEPHTGLGKPKKQHIEAHCENCRAVIVFDRQFTGGIWQHVGKFEVLSLDQQKARQRKKREDLEHSIHYASDHEFSGDEEGNHDSNGMA